jgi:hypothetical protein
MRSLTFGDLHSDTWGAAWALSGGNGGFGLIGNLGAELSDDWRLRGELVDLEVSGSGVRSELADGFDELVTVEGRIAERSVQCIGRRTERTGLNPSDYASIRDVSAWFAPDDGVALLAARPRKARGHEGELLTVSAFEAGRTLPIEEPRLSTTYAGDGSPSRAGLEIWLEQPEDDQEHTTHPPYRAAGEASGNPVGTTAGTLAVQGRRFRWHWRGRDGAGVYLIVRQS